jgi:hypothetical protein
MPPVIEMSIAPFGVEHIAGVTSPAMLMLTFSTDTV